jgi:dolichyl-phosphate beta-glucosyltransferase
MNFWSRVSVHLQATRKAANNSTMEKAIALAGPLLEALPSSVRNLNYRLIAPFVIWGGFLTLLILYLFLRLAAPEPRKPVPSEKLYTTVLEDGTVTEPQTLSCWHDRAVLDWVEAKKKGKPIDIHKAIEPADVFMTVVVPAYNEEQRLRGMLEETVTFLEDEYGTVQEGQHSTKETTTTQPKKRKQAKGTAEKSTPNTTLGWEILLVDDGSTDATVKVAEDFSRTHQLPNRARRLSGPWTHGRTASDAVKIPPGSIRIISLVKNRGKGGAVTHGMRHARGQYVVFADADGASRVDDLAKLVSACQKAEDCEGRAVAVGSRAHLVDSEAVVQRSKLRNFLMHSFHVLLRVLTPPKTAQIKDTQCGFKLFSRATLPYIVPHMHSEGWIFDVEMLMLAEMAAIPVVEVPVGWQEVKGSKLNVVWDSLGMAFGLAALRFCWGFGVYASGPSSTEELPPLEPVYGKW